MQIDSTPVGIPDNPDPSDAAIALVVDRDFARLDELIESGPRSLAELAEIADILKEYYFESEIAEMPLQKVLDWLPGACRRLHNTGEPRA